MRQIQASKNSKQIKMFAVDSVYHTQKVFYDVAEKLLRISAQIS